MYAKVSSPKIFLKNSTGGSSSAGGLMGPTWCAKGKFALIHGAAVGCMCVVVVVITGDVLLFLTPEDMPVVF